MNRNSFCLLLSDLSLTYTHEISRQVYEGRDPDSIALATATVHAIYCLQTFIQQEYPIAILYSKHFFTGAAPTEDQRQTQVMNAIDMLSVPTNWDNLGDVAAARLCLLSLSELLWIICASIPEYGAYCNAIATVLRLCGFKPIHKGKPVRFTVINLESATSLIPVELIYNYRAQ